jgi:hypothetical protein
VLEGPDKGREYPIEGELTIGRTQDNGLVRIERGMSRRHCTIRNEGGVYTVQDLDSANGTFLNDQRLEDLQVLRHGDRIQLGETTFLFDWPEGAVESGISTSPGHQRPQASPAASGKDKQPAARRRRPGGLAVALTVVFVLIVACGTVGAYLLFAEADDSTATYESLDRSAVPVEYSDSVDFRHTAFGLGDHDNSRPDKLIITFPRRKGRPVVHYSAWGVDEIGEVVVRLNGVEIQKVPASVEYRHEITLPLPEAQLKAGANELIFDNTHNPPDADPWEVAYIRIVHQPLLPPDEGLGQEHYRRGVRLYEDREVDPANRFRALEEFQRARSYLEQADPQPAIYHEAGAMAQRVSEELQQIFDLGRFSAERAYRFGDADESRRYLRRTLRYFPDPDDVRRNELSQALRTLE